MRRTEPVIQTDILESLAFSGPLKITHLTIKVNINFKKLVSSLDKLMADGLVNKRRINHKNVVYLITTKGLRAFKEFHKQNYAFKF